VCCLYSAAASVVVVARLHLALCCSCLHVRFYPKPQVAKHNICPPFVLGSLSHELVPFQRIWLWMLISVRSACPVVLYVPRRCTIHSRDSWMTPPCRLCMWPVTGHDDCCLVCAGFACGTNHCCLVCVLCEVPKCVTEWTKPWHDGFIECLIAAEIPVLMQFIM
jgi:hypothetical protein